MINIALPPIEPQVDLPGDEALPDFHRLFDSQWVWESYCARFGARDAAPERLRAQSLIYRPGRRAMVNYIATWPEDLWQPDDRFAIEQQAGRPDQHFHFPDDPLLRGLPAASSPTEAPALIVRHTGLHPRRVFVDVVRYRAGNHAVLRYTLTMTRTGTQAVLFVRVIPPAQVPRLHAAAHLAEGAGFVLPKLQGLWEEGGVVWLARVPGETVRAMVRRGRGPEPQLILDRLAQLWAAPVPLEHSSKDVLGGFRMTRRLLAHLFPQGETRQVLDQVVAGLDPMAKAWRPTALAHNDFYDDQMLIAEDTGKLAMVDFEETGPGEPLIDVGNFLGHQHRSVHFGANSRVAQYRRRFRAAALARFGWSERELDLREAYALFRLSTNPFHSLHADWREAIHKGLETALEVLEGRPCPFHAEA